jgi:hypothetical protein
LAFDGPDSRNQDRILGYEPIYQSHTKKRGEIKMKTAEQTKIIEGVEKIEWGKEKDNTFIGALTAAMHAIGEDVTYNYLMGVSGVAFRLNFRQPNWCPSGADATAGFNHAWPAMKALGYTAKQYNTNADNVSDVMNTRETIVQSINRGYPILAIGLIDDNWGVITGYIDNGEKFLCRSYDTDAEGYALAEKWPWIAFVIGEKKKAPDRYENILNSLKLAVELANTERFGSYASGFAAYEAWADDLLDASRFIGTDKQEEWLMLINAWCYGSLAHARTEAVTYLRIISKEFDEKTAVHLSKASDLYAKITNKLNDGRKYVCFKRQLKDGESWTQKMREAEAGIFKEVSVLEKDATDELKAVLELQTTAL